MGNSGFQVSPSIIILGGIVAIGIFYLLTLQNALKAVSPENRKIEPGGVWVMLVPILNSIFIFFIVDVIATSFKQEYEKYGVYTNGKPTFYLGMAMAILSIAGYFFGVLEIAACACWIAYWIKVNQHKNELIDLNQKFKNDKTSIFS